MKSILHVILIFLFFSQIQIFSNSENEIESKIVKRFTATSWDDCVQKVQEVKDKRELVLTNANWIEEDKTCYASNGGNVVKPPNNCGEFKRLQGSRVQLVNENYECKYIGSGGQTKTEKNIKDPETCQRKVIDLAKQGFFGINARSKFFYYNFYLKLGDSTGECTTIESENEYRRNVEPFTTKSRLISFNGQKGEATIDNDTVSVNFESQAPVRVVKKFIIKEPDGIKKLTWEPSGNIYEHIPLVMKILKKQRYEYEVELSASEISMYGYINSKSAGDFEIIDESNAKTVKHIKLDVKTHPVTPTVVDISKIQGSNLNKIYQKLIFSNPNGVRKIELLSPSLGMKGDGKADRPIKKFELNFYWDKPDQSVSEINFKVTDGLGNNSNVKIALEIKARCHPEGKILAGAGKPGDSCCNGLTLQKPAIGKWYCPKIWCGEIPNRLDWRNGDDCCKGKKLDKPLVGKWSCK